MIVKNVEKKENNALSIQVEIDKEAFEEAVNSAYQKNKKSIAVPGFRKGKAPRMIIENMYGTGVFYDDAIDALAPEAFAFAVEQENLKVVGRPGLANIEIGEDKTVLLTIESALYPEVTLGQYKGIEAPRHEINITDADVDAYIEEMRKRNARKLTVEREAAMGDTVTIDFDGYLDGVAFDGGKGEGVELELGSGQFVPGFEGQVVGMKAGEEKDLDITFPENYHEGLAGKAVVFKVKVHEVTETELPVADDEFAKDISEFDTLADYRDAVKEQLVAKRTQAVTEDFGFHVMAKAVENMVCDVPDAMLEERMGAMMQEYDRNLMSRGMRLEEYIRMSGMDPATFQNMLRPQAEAQVKTDLLLEAVAAAESIEVTEEEVADAVQLIADSYGVPAEQIRLAVPEADIIGDMRKRKANDLIMEHAVATEPVAEEETDEKAETQE